MTRFVILLVSVYAAGFCQADQLEAKIDADEHIVGRSEVFNSESFYILIGPNLNFDKVFDICNDYDGYLAEINSEEEYLFLDATLSVLLKDKAIDFALVGAQYDRPNAPFHGYTHPSAPLYLGHWGRGYPHRSLNMYDSWLLLRKIDGSWLMTDGPKGTDFINKVSICEIHA